MDTVINHTYNIGDKVWVVSNNSVKQQEILAIRANICSNKYPRAKEYYGHNKDIDIIYITDGFPFNMWHEKSLYATKQALLDTL